MTVQAALAPARVTPNPAALHRLMTAYLSSKAVFSALELKVFDALDDGPRTAEQLAPMLQLAERPMRMLLMALDGLKLVRNGTGGYQNKRIASTFLVSTSAQYLGAFAAHQDAHFAKFSRIIEAFRTNRPVAVEEDNSSAPDSTDARARKWAEAFYVSAQMQNEQLAAKAPVAGRRRLADLGCGSAAYSIALARANPDLAITAIDQAPVIKFAAEYVAAAGLTEQIATRPGNIFTESFPGCDVALLSHVLDGYGAEKASSLIAHVYEWLPEGGDLLLHGHFPARGKTAFPYTMGLILLANTPGGEVHDEATARGWLEQAGFRDVRSKQVSSISGLIYGRK